MSQAIELQPREATGTGAARAIRNQGQVPAIIYGGKEEPQMVTAEKSVWKEEAFKPGFFCKVFDLKVGGKTQKVLAKDFQLDPVSDDLIHLDFLRIEKGKKVSVYVPLTYTNHEKSPGIKLGAILNVILRKIEVTCDIDKIPGSVEIDLTDLPAGHSIRTEGLTLPAGVILTRPDRDVTAATIVQTRGSMMGDEEGAGDAAEGEGAEGEGADASEGGEEAKSEG